MKFIHTADLHLDSPLRGLFSYADAPAERLRSATRDAFHNLVTHAIDEQVDFMVIAGDVYDGDWKDFNTGLFFIRQMGRLRQAGVPVYLLYGNHDAESEMTRSLELPDNVHVFSSRKAETFRIEDLKVALHGRSFKVAATTENLLPSYPEPTAGWLNIGVLHTALEGNSEHARYKGLTPAGFVEFLRITEEQRWPKTYHALRKIGLGIDVVEWLESVVGEGADEQVVVAEFVRWMRLNGGRLVSFAQTPNSVKAAPEEASSPGALQVVNRRLGQALSAIGPRRWPEVVLGFAHAIDGLSGRESQVPCRCSSTD